MAETSISGSDLNYKIGQTKIKGDLINAKVGSFEELHINGTISADKISLNETQLILNLDYNKIREYMEKMDKEELSVFIKHLDRLKLMCEKELFHKI